MQLGIQFVQVGNDWAATRALEELDDDLQKERDIRVRILPSYFLISSERLLGHRRHCPVLEA
jgi:hypothetical protein